MEPREQYRTQEDEYGALEEDSGDEYGSRGKGDTMEQVEAPRQ